MRRPNVRLGELSTKDMTVLREGDRAYVGHKSTRGPLRDYSMQHEVWMEWDISEDAIKDKIFKLCIDGEFILLDWEEMMRLGRWV